MLTLLFTMLLKFGLKDSRNIFVLFFGCRKSTKFLLFLYDKENEKIR